MWKSKDRTDGLRGKREVLEEGMLMRDVANTSLRGCGKFSVVKVVLQRMLYLFGSFFREI